MKEPLVVDTGRLHLQGKHLGLFELKEIHHSQVLGPLLGKHLLDVTVSRELKVDIFQIHCLD